MPPELTLSVPPVFFRWCAVPLTVPEAPATSVPALLTVVPPAVPPLRMVSVPPLSTFAAAAEPATAVAELRPGSIVAASTPNWPPRRDAGKTYRC